MSNTVKSLLIAAMLTSGTALWAQEQAAQAAPAADPALNLGEQLDENGEPLGTTYDLEAKGDWAIRCLRSPAEQDPCEMTQVLTDGEGNNVAEISMFKLPDGQAAVAGATIATPLETLLTEQLRIAVDSAPAKRYPFRFCTQAGCYAQVGFTAEEIAAFKKGSKATLTIVPRMAPDQQVGVTMSLSGFTDAFESIPAR